MPKNTQAQEGCQQRPLSPVRPGNVLYRKRRRNVPKHLEGDIWDTSIEDLIVYPTGMTRPPQHLLRKVRQAISAVEPPEPPPQYFATQRQTVSCVVYNKLVKTQKQTITWKLSLLRGVLNFLKREIPQAREDNVLAPAFVSLSSVERKYVIAIMLPQYIIPKFLKLKPSKESNKFISRQIEDKMNVTVKFISGQHSGRDKISMEALLSQLPRKVDTVFRGMVQNFMMSNETPSLKTFLTKLKNEATVMAPSESTGDARDYDVLVRLKSGARFKVEKRYTMKGSVLRVAKGTKIEFFWSHLFKWTRSLSMQMESRKSLFGRMPVSLLTLIIEYTVEVPLPEPDFRNWFTTPVPICRLTLVDKKKQKRYSYSQRHSNDSYIKANPRNFWALKKRFYLPKISVEEVERVFQLFDGFDYKLESTD